MGMTGREFVVPIATPTAVTVQVDLFELIPADDHPILIHGIRLYQTTDFGDAQEEILGLELRRGGTAMTSGSGGTTGVASAPMDPGDTASGTLAEYLNTTLATFTGGGLIWNDGWNVRNPYVYDFLPEDRPKCHQGNGGIVLRLGAAPADSLTIGGSLTYEEL